MTDLKLIIDGQPVTAQSGMTVLDAARSAGIYIPTLCYHPDLAPYGACRLCIVEIDKMRGLPTACTTPAAEGMVISTHNNRINQFRRDILELTLAESRHPCLACEKLDTCGPGDSCAKNIADSVRCAACPRNGDCELRQVARYIGIIGTDLPYIGTQKAVDSENPFFERDYNLCIRCGRCIRVCQEIRGNGAVAWTYRGSEALPGTMFGESLRDADCQYCGACVDACPVAALVERDRKSEGLGDRTVKTTCPYCGVGCQLNLSIKNGKIIESLPDRDNECNKGQACVKGRFGIREVVHSPERLTMPLVRRNGRFEEASWDEAFEYIVKKLGNYKKEEIAVLASAKCTNEDNYVFQKFTRVVLGHNHIDHCARLCHAPTVAGLAATFGSGAMTNSFNEFGDSACILAIGTNTTEAHPVIALQVFKSHSKGNKLIVINPREIKLARMADIWLQQIPGTDVPLLMGMARVIVDENLHDREFIAARCESFEVFKDSLRAFDLETVEKITGVPAAKIAAAARLYARTKPGAILYTMGITQHSHGTDNVQAVANLAMLTGNIGQPGSGVNPLRGQNNVQGACDMGALPNVFPGYQNVADDVARQKWEKAWGVPLSGTPGRTVTEMFDAVHDGQVRAMYIIGENPPLSEPDAAHALKALQKLDFLVVQDIFMTETAREADVVLPAVSFAEKDGTFTNTERRVQRVRKAVDLGYDLKPDWWITAQLASRMGGRGFQWQSAADILGEINGLTPSYAGITWERLDKGGLQWPCPNAEHPGTPILHTRQFARGKGKFMPLAYRPAAELPDEDYPLILTTGRSLYQYHTGTMTRKVKGLNILHGIALVEINPADAEKFGITDGTTVALASRRGQIDVTAKVSTVSPPGVVYMNFHFAEAAANILTNKALDPVAKIPEYKVCAVRIAKKS